MRFPMGGAVNPEKQRALETRARRIARVLLEDSDLSDFELEIRIEMLAAEILWNVLMTCNPGEE